MIVGLLNQKGGVGKTTLAINLAHALKIVTNKKILLVDADPQGSSRDWNLWNQGSVIQTIGLDRPSIEKDIQEPASAYDWTVIDGPSKIDKLAAAIIRCSDVILIPSKTSQLELNAIRPFIEMIEYWQSKEGKPKFAVVVTQQVANTICAKNTKKTLRENDIPLFKTGTTNRVAYIDSINAGRTVLEDKDKTARAEILALVNELLEFIV